MKVLVTGASGFLGTALCAALEPRCDLLIRLNSRICDLTHPESLLRYTSHKYDRIYHLAAWTRTGDSSLTLPGDQWLFNQAINTNVLAFWHQQQPQAKLISIGAACAYDPGSPPVEDRYLQGNPPAASFTFAMTKRMLHAGQVALARQFGMRHLTVVAPTLYGPDYHTDARRPTHFVPNLIRKILRAKLYDEPATLRGDGDEQRELLHVDDFVRLLLDLSDRAENDIVNVGPGEQHPVRHLANLICDIAHYPPTRIRYDGTNYAGTPNQCLDTTKLRTLLPNPNLTPLEPGLRNTLDWFLKRQLTLFPRRPLAA